MTVLAVVLDGLMTCEEACTAMGSWGPLLFTIAYTAWRWYKAAQLAKQNAAAAAVHKAQAEQHKEEVQELRVKVASLSPPPERPVVPVVVHVPVQPPPPKDLLQSADADKGESS